MKKNFSYLMLALVLLCASADIKAQSASPFSAVPVDSSVSFSKYAAGTSIFGISARVAQGTVLSTADPLLGTNLQFQPYSSIVYASVTSNTMYLGYGTAGFLMFQDTTGAGVGWHMTNWTAAKGGDGSTLIVLNLEAPFWLGNPPAGVSTTLEQMVTAGSAQLVFSIQTNNVTLNDLCNVGEKGKLANVSSVSYSSNGYLYLYH